MSENVFIPKMKHIAENEPVADTATATDSVGKKMLSAVQYLLVALFGLLPIIFYPSSLAPVGNSKTMFAVAVVAVSVVVLSLLMLRQRKMRTVMPLSLGIFWTFILVSFASGMFSGDTQDALRGAFLESQTAGFWLVAGLVMTLPLVFQSSKIMTIKSIILFAASSLILLVYVLVRNIFGGDVLSFSTFHSQTVTPIGGFNDLAMFSGMVIALSLVTLAQLPLRVFARYILLGVIVLGLLHLAVVNFFMVWVAVGFFALLVLVFQLSRDTIFKAGAHHAPPSRELIIAAAVVSIVSILFVIAGDYFGTQASRVIDVNYVEVRPSLEATTGIIRSVYDSGDALIGIGSNRFADAWRLYKDPTINQTLFWDTEFNAGSSLVATLFATMGILGGTLMVLFHLMVLYVGYRMLLRPQHKDSYWYYLGIVSCTAACFLWGFSYIYVPSVAILLLAAFFTGLLFVASAALLPATVRTIPLATNQQRGFGLMTVAILLIVTSVVVSYMSNQQYQAQDIYAKAQVKAKNVTEFDESVTAAFNKYPDDRFLNADAQAYISEMNTMIQTRDLSKEDEQKALLGVAERALELAQNAVDLDRTNPRNHAVLAAVYANLASLDIGPALEKAESSLKDAKRFDPTNPGYGLIAAQLSARIGDTDKARQEVSEVLRQKPNYTEALYFSAQLDIAEGKVESAIETTKSIITLEPKNPTRYFQLGVLLAAHDDLEQAIAAYRAAISLDPQYANARYLLALAYLNSNQSDKGLEQLYIVRETNLTNPELTALIEKVENGTYTPETSTESATLSETTVDESIEGTIPDAVGESNLLTPLNTINSAAETVPTEEPSVATEATIEADTVTEPLPAE